MGLTDRDALPYRTILNEARCAKIKPHVINTVITDVSKKSSERARTDTDKKRPASSISQSDQEKAKLTEQHRERLSLLLSTGRVATHSTEFGVGMQVHLSPRAPTETTDVTAGASTDPSSAAASSSAASGGDFTADESAKRAGPKAKTKSSMTKKDKSVVMETEAEIPGGSGSKEQDWEKEMEDFFAAELG